ncbi:MAG: tRNA pseudouridine(38-40) synthase TruA [Cryomorphaceae bacterium]|nr:tRNA pseudouridine(38-40) synthase TruA [Flavobacteriales bacterium]
MARYFLQLAYDGSNYCGWQVQPGVNTVQEEVEKALAIFVKDLGRVVGCGRTDTGVHASAYFLHFDTAMDLPENFCFKMNAVLPMDIAINGIMPVNGDFHARFSAYSRSYDYFIHFSKNPFRNAYSVYHPRKLDLERMNAAAEFLIGERDFTSFSKGQTQTKTNICNVSAAEWKHIDDGVVFSITANRFLRNMVRAIVGTMLPIGEGSEEPNHILAVMEKKSRMAAGKSAHPQGLFLKEIRYPEIHVASNR